jgi:hypothetical protein
VGRLSPGAAAHPDAQARSEAAEALAQVHALRTALKREHDEVLRLRRALREMAAERDHLRAAAGVAPRAGDAAGPVTPEAAEQLASSVVEGRAARRPAAAAAAASASPFGGLPGSQ